MMIGNILVHKNVAKLQFVITCKFVFGFFSRAGEKEFQVQQAFGIQAKIGVCVSLWMAFYFFK